MHALHVVTAATSTATRRIGRAFLRGLRGATDFDRIRFCLFVFMFIGPLIGVAEWYTQQRIDDILRRGVTAEATVTGSRAIHHRGSSYTLDLAWRDAHGAQHQVGGISVSAAVYNRVARARAPKVGIKYLAGGASTRRTVALRDDPGRTAQAPRMIPQWSVPSLLGFAAIVLMTLWRRCRMRRMAPIAA